eukprot:4932626-Amphidinium_carterae.1
MAGGNVKQLPDSDKAFPNCPHCSQARCWVVFLSSVARSCMSGTASMAAAVCLHNNAFLVRHFRVRLTTNTCQHIRP